MESNESLLAVVCRFVPYDQWLITHLDPSWSVKQVKLWILSKCNLVDAPDLPRYRAVSPITFASHSRGPSFDASNGDDSDDEGGNESSSVEDGARYSKTNRKLAESWPSHLPRRRSESCIDDPAPPESGAVDLSTRYTILTFSNTHILEDDFVLSWYNIRPHELLEIHPAGCIVRLQREVMVQYVRPYFEARVKALRKAPSSSSQEGFVDRVGAGRSKNDKTAGKTRLVSSDPLVYGMFGDRNEPKKKKTTKLEWRERWVVIHEGVLSLCNDRSDSNPSQRIPLSSFIAFRGAEHLKNTRAPPVTGQRIVCAKFSVSSRSPPFQKQVDKHLSTSSSSVFQQHTTRHPRMLSRSQPSDSSSRIAASQSPTSSPSSHLRAPSSSSPIPSTSSLSRSYASTAPTMQDHESIDESRRDGLKTILGCGSGSGPCGYGDSSKAGRDDRNNAMSNPNASASSSVSEYDEDDEVDTAERKQMDKGKRKAKEVEDMEKAQVKDADKEDAHEWIIMDFCDDTAFTAILRILHRHSTRPIMSSFLPQSSTVISNTIQPPTPATSLHTPMGFISPFSNALISPFDSPTVYPMSLGTTPYPEWRMEMVNRARKSGLGCLDKGMEWFLGGEYGEYSRAEACSVGKDSRLTSGNRSSRPRSDTMKNATANGTVGARDVMPVTEEGSDPESDDLELSDCEWQGWTLDLDRQGQMRRAEARCKRQTTTSVTALSSPPSSHSSRDCSHTRPTPALSPSIIADSSSLTHPGQNLSRSQQSVDGGTPILTNPVYSSITSTVSVSSKPTHVRRRSSTVTTGGMKLLQKKDKSKETDVQPAPYEDSQASAPGTNTVKRKKSILSRPHLPLTFCDLSTSDIEEFQLAKTAAASQSPPRTSILRHARSASNLRSTRLVNVEAMGPTVAEDPDVLTVVQGERKPGIVKGVSAQAERLLAKGWGSTLGFVDGRVGFGAGSFYG